MLAQLMERHLGQFSLPTHSLLHIVILSHNCQAYLQVSHCYPLLEVQVCRSFQRLHFSPFPPFLPFFHVIKEAILSLFNQTLVKGLYGGMQELGS